MVRAVLAADAASRRWDNLIKLTHPDGSSVSYRVEPSYSNRLEEVNERGVITRNAYDANNRLVTMVDAAGGITRREYNARGQLE